MTTISIWEVLAILAIHWYADFVRQTDKQAINKSKEWKWLLSHTADYSLVWLLFAPAMFVIFGNIYQGFLLKGLLFALFTFVCHTGQDYFTSRLNARLWREEKRHLFFATVGFDQFLHYVQLILTYQYLKP